MYYKIKEQKRDELQEGRTLVYIADKCKYSRQYITDTFNGKINITRECAVNILRGLAENSIKILGLIKQKGINDTIEYFFEKVE